MAHQFYSEGFKILGAGITMQERYRSLLKYYRKTTGFDETNPLAILHHVISIYGQ